MGNQIFLTVLSLSLSGTLTGILILCIRPLTKRFFSKKWNYYVWLVMVIRLVLPIGLGINLIGDLFSAENAWNSVKAESSIEEMTYNGEKVLGGAIAESTEMTNASEIVKAADVSNQFENDNYVIRDARHTAGEKSISLYEGVQSLFSSLWIIWLFGVACAICMKGKDYRRFVAYVKSGRQEIGKGKIRDLADQLSQKLGIKRTIKIYKSPLVSGPMLIGLWKPYMILPQDSCSGDIAQKDISLILHHELVHFRKKDLWYKWLYQAVLCIHWFNPVLYLIGRKLNADCELACDEAVLANLTLEERKVYGNVLLDAAEHKIDFKRSVLSTTLLEDKGTLKERLIAILHYKKTKGILAVFSIGLLGVIVVLACFAGARTGGRRNSASASREFMAGGYVSGWDIVANGYTSLWDSFGEAVGALWDGIGQVWGDLGETLSDADQFFFQEMVFDTNGEAWKAYEDDAVLAGEDIYDVWRAYSYMGNGVNVDCQKLTLNGFDTYEILYAKEAFTQTLDFEVKLISGRMKLIHVGADGNVTLLAELEEGEKLNSRIDISLTEGRNAVKIVGQGAEIQKLHLEFGDQNNKNILKLYNSDTMEAAELLCGEFREGKINVERFMDAVPYMEEDDLCECAKILFSTGADLTMDQITDLVVYGNLSIGTYLADAVEKGVMSPFTGEEIREDLVYYISSADTLRLVECMEETLDFETLEALIPYVDDEDMEKCLDIYLEQGNEISYEEFSHISNYLSEDVIKRLDGKER